MDLKYNFKLLLICHTHNRQKPPNRIQNRNNNIKKAQYDHLFAQTTIFCAKISILLYSFNKYKCTK